MFTCFPDKRLVSPGGETEVAWERPTMIAIRDVVELRGQSAAGPSR
jgi:hypothetical protein